MATNVEMQEAQARFTELVARATGGEELILTEAGKPVARIVPAEAAPARRIAGLHPGNFQASEDFDEPLADELWLGEQEKRS